MTQQLYLPQKKWKLMFTQIFIHESSNSFICNSQEEETLCYDLNVCLPQIHVLKY